MRNLLAVAALAFAAGACTATPPAGKPMDAAMLMSSGGPVTSSMGAPVTCRNWNCTCECPKGCFQ